MFDRIPSLLRACSDAGLNPLRETAGFGAGVVAVSIVLGANAIHSDGTGLVELRPEPAELSRPYGDHPISQGEER